MLSVRQCLVRLRKQRTHRAARVHVRTSPQPDGGAKARAPGLRAALWSRSAEAEHGSNETARGGLKKNPKHRERFSWKPALFHSQVLRASLATHKDIPRRGRRNSGPGGAGTALPRTARTRRCAGLPGARQVRGAARSGAGNPPSRTAVVRSGKMAAGRSGSGECAAGRPASYRSAPCWARASCGCRRCQRIEGPL